MNYIEKMLQDYCPNGVEWKELGEVCNVVTDFTAAGSFASNAKNVKYLKEPDFAQLIRTTDLKSKFRVVFNYRKYNIAVILPNVRNICNHSGHKIIIIFNIFGNHFYYIIILPGKTYHF